MIADIPALTSAEVVIAGNASEIGRPLRTGAIRSRHRRRATVSQSHDRQSEVDNQGCGFLCVLTHEHNHLQLW
jgi:hypothetical protein